MPQLSETEGKATLIYAPQVSGPEVTPIPPGQWIIGGLTSCTWTVALHVDVAPYKSLTVSVTSLSPVSAQVKVLGETVIVSNPQAAVLPLFTSSAVMEAWPAVSRFIVTDLQTA